ncbi:MAG TPA: IS1182 family transposase, partial [Casimicrobiaceae bacterium]
DREPTLLPAARVSQLKEKIAAVKAHLRKLGTIEKQMLQTPGQQVSLTDPDARSMATSGRGTGIVGYNVQTAVDTNHHLIVAHEVTNIGHDRTQLFSMAKQARSAMGTQELTALADRGYFNSPEILDCDQAGMTPLVPKPLTSNSKADGRFDKRDFVYIAEDDEYRCPAGQRAIKRFTTIENGMTLHKYWSSACPKCRLKTQCTTSNYRRIARWEHEAVLDAMQQRLDRQPDAMKLRRQTVEHPFGTFKSWMGSTHFLTKRLPRVSTEMSLHVLAYNLKRVMQIMGIRPLMQAMRA